MTIRRSTLAVVLVVVGILVGGILSTQAVAQRRLPSPRRLSDSGSDLWDLERQTSPKDVPTRTVPSELDRDKMHSLALFGQARLLYQRNEAAKALQTYQRAHHWNPDSGQAAMEAFPLAFYLERPGEATRYALIAAEKGKPDTQLMRQIALHLVQDEEYDRARSLYKRILERMDGEPRDGEWVAAQFEAGRLYFLQEDYNASADSFAVVMDGLDDPGKYSLDKEVADQILGDPSLTYGLFGEAFLEANRLERAERMFRKAQNLEPNKNLFAYHSARLAAKRNQNDQALTKLNEYLDANTAEAGTEPYDWLKKLAPDTWLTQLEKRHANNPVSSLTDYLAEHFEENDKPKRALELYQQLNSEKMTGYSAQSVVRMASKTQNVQALVKVLGQVIARTSDIETLELDDLVNEKDSTPSDVARKTFEFAKQTLLPPKTTRQREQLFGVGLLAIRSNELELGREFVDAAIENADQKSQTDWLFSSGLEMFMLDDFAGAATQLRTRLKSGNEADSSIVVFYLATALELDEKNKEAMAVIDRAISRTPDSPLLESRKAWLAYHNDENEKAIELYTAFIEKYGKEYASEGVRDLVKEAKSSLSNLYLVKKDVDTAIDWLQQVLDEYPEDTGAMNDLGYLLADENLHLQRALRMTKFAVKNEPENNAYLDSLGWALYRLERYEEAAEYLQRATDVQEPDGIILEHLGDVHDKMEQPSKAKSAWERALKAFRKDDDKEHVAIVEGKIAALKQQD